MPKFSGPKPAMDAEPTRHDKATGQFTGGGSDESKAPEHDARSQEHLAAHNSHQNIGFAARAAGDRPTEHAHLRAAAAHLRAGSAHAQAAFANRVNSGGRSILEQGGMPMDGSKMGTHAHGMSAKATKVSGKATSVTPAGVPSKG